MIYGWENNNKIQFWLAGRRNVSAARELTVSILRERESVLNNAQRFREGAKINIPQHCCSTLGLAEVLNLILVPSQFNSALSRAPFISNNSKVLANLAGWLACITR